MRAALKQTVGRVAVAVCAAGWIGVAGIAGAAEPAGPATGGPCVADVQGEGGDVPGSDAELLCAVNTPDGTADSSDAGSPVLRYATLSLVAATGAAVGVKIAERRRR